MASRSRSPKSARTLASTSRSASSQRRRSSQPTSASSRERNSRPVAIAQRKIARLCAALLRHPRGRRVKIFSNTRGTQVRWVGLTSRMSSSRRCGSRCQNASVPPTSMVSIWTIRASECASGRNMNVTTGGPRDRDLLVQARRRDPARVAEHAGLGRPGGAGGVHQRRQIAGVDPGHALVDRAGIDACAGRAELLERRARRGLPVSRTAWAARGSGPAPARPSRAAPGPRRTRAGSRSG